MRILISALVLAIAGANSATLEAKNLTKQSLDAYLASRTSFHHEKIRVADALKTLLGPLREPYGYAGSLPADKLIGPFSLHSKPVSEVLQAVLKAADNRHSLQWNSKVGMISIELKPELQAELDRRLHEKFLREEARRAVFRGDLASRLVMADRAEVMLLDDSVKPVARTEAMAVRPYRTTAAIVKRRTLVGDEKSKIVNALCRALRESNPGSGAFCHYPIHGLRLFRGKAMVFESTFCWACQNYYLDYGKGAAWTGIHGDELRKALSWAMPIPKARRRPLVSARL